MLAAAFASMHCPSALQLCIVGSPNCHAGQFGGPPQGQFGGPQGQFGGSQGQFGGPPQGQFGGNQGQYGQLLLYCSP